MVLRPDYRITSIDMLHSPPHHHLEQRSRQADSGLLGVTLYFLWALTMGGLGALLLTRLALAQASPAQSTTLTLTINSSQDGPILADDYLTLREAIAITNGTLSPDRLSQAEQDQLTATSEPTMAYRLVFDLPSDQTTIYLQQELPPLASPDLVLDGTSQPGYGAVWADEAADETVDETTLAPPTPIVSLTPAPGVEIGRGLTITADGVTVRGLRLYGFTSRPGTAATLPADIFISQPLSSSDVSLQNSDDPPQGVVIEANWLGVDPTMAQMPGCDAAVARSDRPATRSAFGVSVFNGVGTVIRHNWIAHHDGSGIITSVRAEQLQVNSNLISHNGLAGMPDAIRLEGRIHQSQVVNNQICSNGGSGIFLFKPEGDVLIQGNQIEANGQRFRRAAVYLMGDDHQVTDNQIVQQPGPGVVVAAYPASRRNQIQGNRFADLDGLSIDLIAQSNVGVEDYQRGDGPNPRRNSPNRRLDTGNGAVDAPRWLSSEFFVLNGVVHLDGEADAGATVEIYRVQSQGYYGPLSESLGMVPTDDQGRFSFSTADLMPGEQVSAIATDPRYGTSEPARNAAICALGPSAPAAPAGICPVGVENDRHEAAP